MINQQQQQQQQSSSKYIWRSVSSSQRHFSYSGESHIIALWPIAKVCFIFFAISRCVPVGWILSS
jgi:hypothetical protein